MNKKTDMVDKDWSVIFTQKAEKDFAKLDHDVQKRIHKAIKSKLVKNPNEYLISLVGDKKGAYKFRVGDYRLICKKENKQIVIIVLKVKHRKEVYR